MTGIWSSDSAEYDLVLSGAVEQLAFDDNEPKYQTERLSLAFEGEPLDNFIESRKKLERLGYQLA